MLVVSANCKQRGAAMGGGMSCRNGRFERIQAWHSSSCYSPISVEVRTQQELPAISTLCLKHLAVLRKPGGITWNFCWTF